MKQNLDIRVAVSSIGSALNRYQVLLFFIVISILVAVALIMIVRLFTVTPIDTATDNAAAPLISAENKETVEKLSQLRESTNLEDIPAPEGRFSPFSERTWRTDIMER
jgi:hypothetical protein